MKIVSKISEVPKQKHYAILVQDSHYVQGYDQHDSGYTSEHLSYEYTFDKDEWAKEVERRVNQKHAYDGGFIPIEVNPAKVKVSVSVDIEQVEVVK